MKVLGLVASPRKLGNTEILVKEMLASLPPETEKEMIRLPQLKIKNCSACYFCLPQENVCVLEDDLAFLLDRVKGADKVIIASPCYFLGPHTSVKLIGDRLISILNNGREFSGKSCVTLTVYGIEGWEGYAREGLMNFARFLHLNVIGTMSVRAASPGEAAAPEIIEQARKLARTLLESEEEDKKGLANTCQVCGSTLFQVGVKGDVRCVMCNAKGRLVHENGVLSLNLRSDGHNRFSPEGMAEHGCLLEQVKTNYIASRAKLAKIRRPYEAYDWWVVPKDKD